MLYDRDKVICTQPKTACATCHERIARPVGRPKGEGVVDWNDPASVDAYHKRYREAHKDEREQARLRFLERHPNYFKDYYKRHAAEMKARAAKETDEPGQD